MTGGDTSALAGVPKAMPGLLRAERLGAKAAAVGLIGTTLLECVPNFTKSYWNSMRRSKLSRV